VNEAPEPSEPTPDLRLPWRRGAREVGIALAFYAVALALALATIGFNPFEDDPGGDFEAVSWSLVDWNVHYWNLWEFQRFYKGEPVLYHTDAEFFPDGLDTLTVQGDPFLKLLGGLIALVFPAPMTYLLVVLLVFLGNGVGGFVLVRSLTGSRIAGLVSGLLLCFAGATAWSVNTGNLESGLWLWMCLYLTLLCRVLRLGRWQDALGAGVLCALAGLTNLTVMHNLVILSAILLLASVRTLSWAKVRAVALMCGVILLLLLPLVLSFLSAKREQNQGYAAAFFVEHELTDIGGLALPMLNSYPPKRYLPYNRVDNGDVLDTHEYNKEDADTYYFAFVLLAFALMFTPRRCLPWVVASAVFFALCLGPVYVYVPKGGSPTTYPLPFKYAYMVLPFFDNIHFPHRMFNYALLCMGVAIGFGVQRLMELPRRTTVALLAGLILVGSYGELLYKWSVRSAPRAEISPFYERLADEPGDFGVITFPLDFGIIDSRYLYFQTVHGKPVFNGSVPRYFGENGIPNVRRLKANPILLRSYNLQKEELPDRVNLTFVDIHDHYRTLYLSDVQRAQEHLAEMGLRYVILHHELRWGPRLGMSFPRDCALRTFLGSTLGAPVYEDHDLVVFAVPDPGDPEREWGGPKPSP
jgi:4-amino-4-deoxy-L-arabinose transferase-like glycosyltransferase